MNVALNSRSVKTVLMVVAVAALVATTASLFSTRGTGDMKIWERWTNNAMRLGVVAGFRENDNDYPPLSNVVLWATGHAGRAAGLPVATATKLSLVVFLAVTLIVWFAWVHSAPLTLALWSACVLNAVGMGYLDIYAMPPLILSLWALQRNKATASVTWFSVACLVKWQPLVIAPFLLLHVGREWWPPSSTHAKKWLALLLPSLAILVVAVAVFEPFPFFRAFAKSLGHRVLSGDTLNLPWIATWLYQGFSQGLGGFTGQVAGIASAPLWLRLPFKFLFAWQFLALLYRYVTGPVRIERTLAYSLVGFLAYVVLSSGVHENHWFVPSVLAIVLIQFDRRWLAPALALGVVANLNLLLFYGFDGHGLPFSRVVGIDVSVLLATAVVGMFFWIAAVIRRRDMTDGRWSSSGATTS